MSANLDEESIITKVISWAWAVVLGLVAVIWRMLNGKIDQKASQESVDRAITTLEAHVEQDAEIHERIFDKLNEHLKVTSRIEGVLSEIRDRR